MRSRPRSALHVPLLHTALVAVSVIALTAILSLAPHAGTSLAARPALALAEPTTQTVSAESPTGPTTAPVAPTVTIETFGYKFGKAPRGCRFVADVRNVKAGTFTQKQNGLMASVRRRVMKSAGAKAWHRYFLNKWVPQLKDGDKIAIGCARGHHRSVSLAVVLGADLVAKGYKVEFIHRDIKKRW